MKLHLRTEILDVIETLSSRYLQGKIQAIRLGLISLLSGGHLLIEDAPGLGKTSLALALAGILDLSFGRVQCTSDLMPSDITGLSVFDRERNSFHFVEGPIFNNLILVDEVNRAMPKTQSAMLEAMEEQRVTIEGVTYQLPDPFMVVATQNPQEQIGTYPLPESQIDRFLATSGIGYPPAKLEKKILKLGSVRNELELLTPILNREQIIEARDFVQQSISIQDSVVDYIHQILESSRTSPWLANGISTRGGLSLVAAARAEAYLEGRSFVAPDDVQKIAVAVAAHRVILQPEQLHRSKEEVMRSLLADIPVPIV
jgi:MoxR-like ATPase